MQNKLNTSTVFAEHMIFVLNQIIVLVNFLLDKQKSQLKSHFIYKKETICNNIKEINVLDFITSMSRRGRAKNSCPK